MKNLIPGKLELAILTSAAALSTLIVAVCPVFDLAMAAVAIPLFLSCAILGMRRNVKLAEIYATTRRAELLDRAAD